MRSDLITIVTFSESIDAHFAKDLLSDEGIEVFISENESSWSSNDVNTIKIRLQVKDKDVIRASEILQKNGIT